MPEATNTELLIKNILSPTLAKLNFKDYNVNLNDCTAKGEGYVGQIWRAKIQQQNEETNLIVKLASQDEDQRNFIRADLLYRNEVGFYSVVFPALDKFQKDRKVKQFFQIPKCFGTWLKDKQEAVVLEDLKAAGFEMHDRKKTLDEDHIALVFKQYGKFHALSLALRDQQPQVFKKSTAELVNVFPDVFPNLIGGLLQQIQKNVQMLKQQGLTAESQLAQKIAEEVWEVIKMPYDPDDPFSVVTHGDCWSNNMMFKYDETTRKPVDHRFLDFQVSRVHSPVFDLSYFFYASAPKRIMDDVDKYLQIYHNSLSDFLKQLGSDPEKVFPFEVLQRHWKKYRKFGLTMSLFIFRFTLCEEDEAVTLTGENYADGFGKDVSSQKEQDRRVTDVVKHFVETGGVL